MKKRFQTLAIAVSLMLWLAPQICAQSVSIKVRQASVSDVLDEIVAQTGCTLYYTEPPVDLDRKVTLNVREASLQEALEKLFAGQNIKVLVNGSKVYLSEKQLPETAMQPKQLTYSGVVKGSDGLPVIGAAILLGGTLDGATTDIDGHYSLSAVPGSVLVVSCMGYESRQITMGTNPHLDITLELASVQLQEVVMVGYSSRTREKLISSVSSIGGDKLVQSDVPNLENALSGKVSGVFSRQTSGEPGNDGADIRIRGFGSALVVVDGIPVRSYSDLDPNEIESVSVLKDASAAAVYGMQGANGVILVTTKRGSRNKPTSVEVISKYGVQMPTRYPKAANSRQYQEFLNEYTINRRLIGNHSYTALAGDMSIQDTQYDTDWYSLMIQPAPESRTKELSSEGESSYLALAQEWFDRLRSDHGGLPPKTMTLNIVRHERRVDMMFENSRYWDLKRWHTGHLMDGFVGMALHPILNIDESVSPVTMYYTVERAEGHNQSGNEVHYFKERDYYCPVPIDQHPGLSQNIGWEGIPTSIYDHPSWN